MRLFCFSFWRRTSTPMPFLKSCCSLHLPKSSSEYLRWVGVCDWKLLPLATGCLAQRLKTKLLGRLKTMVRHNCGHRAKDVSQSVTWRREMQCSDNWGNKAKDVTQSTAWRREMQKEKVSVRHSCGNSQGCHSIDCPEERDAERGSQRQCQTQLWEQPRMSLSWLLGGERCKEKCLTVFPKLPGKRMGHCQCRSETKVGMVSRATLGKLPRGVVQLVSELYRDWTELSAILDHYRSPKWPWCFMSQNSLCWPKCGVAILWRRIRIHHDLGFLLHSVSSSPKRRKSSCVSFLLQFIYCQIDPAFKMGVKMEEEVPRVLKMLGYPFNISKSSMHAAGTPHTWPYLLAALVWMVELVKVRCWSTCSLSPRVASMQRAQLTPGPTSWQLWSGWWCWSR